MEIFKSANMPCFFVASLSTSNKKYMKLSHILALQYLNKSSDLIFPFPWH